MWATRNFRCYLYGLKFVIKTDLSALTYLRNFADHNSRLMWWILKISDLNFLVQHRAGRKIGHADALCRHVAAIMYEYSLDKETIRREQENDVFCTKQNPGYFSSNYEFLGGQRWCHVQAPPPRKTSGCYTEDFDSEGTQGKSRPKICSTPRH